MTYNWLSGKITDYPILVWTLIMLVGYFCAVHLLRVSCSDTLRTYASEISIFVAALLGAFWWRYVGKKEKKEG